MTKKELAALLGISGAMVSRLAKRGMPTDSLERAKRWRKRHLEPGRIKGAKFDPNAKAVSNESAAVFEVERLATVVLPRLAESGSDLDRESIIAPLRAAIRAAPDFVQPRLPALVWWALLRWAVVDETIDPLLDVHQQSITPDDLDDLIPHTSALFRNEALRIAADIYDYAQESQANEPV